jgi:hypothetical protein
MKRWSWRFRRRGRPRGRHAIIDRRLLEWVQCAGCLGQVPADAIHTTCGRAGGYPILIRATKHGPPCCPGACRRCARCLEDQGWCMRCVTCRACCPGHYLELLPGTG